MIVGDLDFRALRGGPEQVFMLLRNFGYTSTRFGTVVAPAGFITDFGSVPKLLRWLVDGDDYHLLPGSVVHDYLYAHGGDIGIGRTFTRKEADELLREAMECVGSPRWKMWAVYLAVRVGGWFAWRRR